jgi:WhiB family transcriptional regulator, redox-sensing transcriptional regulator
MGYIVCSTNGHIPETKPLSSRHRQRTVRPVPRQPPASITNQEFDVSILASSLTLAHADYSWRSNSLCRDTDPDLFFPIGTTGHALTQIERAKEVCGECPVSVSCLEFALETNQDSGIWGGTSEEERRTIRRAQVAHAKATRAAS